MKIVESKFWKEALRSQGSDDVDRTETTPFRELVKEIPGTDVLNCEFSLCTEAVRF